MEEKDNKTKKGEVVVEVKEEVEKAQKCLSNPFSSFFFAVLVLLGLLLLCCLFLIGCFNKTPHVIRSQ